MNYIKDNPYCDIEAIVDDCGIPKNSISRMLHSLEDNQIINFSSDPSSFGRESGWIITQQNNPNVGKTR